jgi:hypothetical protein
MKTTHDVSEAVCARIAAKLKDGGWRIFSHVVCVSDINKTDYYCPNCYADSQTMSTVCLVYNAGFIARASVCSKCWKKIVAYQIVTPRDEQRAEVEVETVQHSLFEIEGETDGTEVGSLDTDDGAQLRDDRAVRGEPEARRGNQLRAF